MCERVCHKRPSIYKVPEHLRKLNENAYTPWHVSVGPYHHKSHKYKVMEEQKLVYMKALILRRRSRASNNNAGEVKEEEIDEYFKEVEKLESKARANYAETIELNKDDFVKMLLIDGCFVVEFLCRKIRKLAKFEDEAMIKFDEMYKFINNTYKEMNPKYDFILKSTRTAFEVRRDLTLLENQLPYFVLETLFNFTFSCKANKPNFKAIVYCTLRTSIPNISHILNEDDIAQRIELEPETTAHFVSFLKSCCGPAKEAEEGTFTPEEQSVRNRSVIISIDHQHEKIKEFPCLCNMKTHELRVPSASRLAKSGIVFETMEGETPLLQINFDSKKGVLKMPVLILWHHTETFFRNIMAYELYNHTANYSQNISVSDYMCFMDDLINSKEDVAVLVKSGIIQNWLESDEVATDLFNSITKHILADYSSYSSTCKQMNEFRKKYNIRQLKAALQQDYFNQPWAIVYFITGVIIQTAASIIQAVTSI
ncbi:putative UPF0481 protein At3g02645 [Beta vulgaris subsp. vulgaris]|uniref:putative UPF0481 protein At3g02645 n=1 Tax=Beta vulgaris subsp. vulgaris TaxID=3555 RepID=UPI0020369010|nr:putative UPF0481 protein At3g02645 [Beta vulgaris subsp. vulgaris]